MAKTNTKTKEKKTARGHKFTRAWKSADGKEVEKGDVVKAQGGKLEGVVTTRFTRPKGRIPMVMLASGAARKGKGKGVRNTSLPASEVTIIKKGGGGK